jgi:hypothetical protein
VVEEPLAGRRADERVAPAADRRYWAFGLSGLPFSSALIE